MIPIILKDQHLFNPQSNSFSLRNGVTHNVVVLGVMLTLLFFLIYNINLFSATALSQNIESLFQMLQRAVRLLRLLSLIVVAMLGMTVGIMVGLGMGQGRHLVIDWFTSVFFVLCASTIVDAILYITLGSVKLTQ